MEQVESPSLECPKMCGCGTWGRGLVVSTASLELMTLESFPNFNSIILRTQGYQKSPSQPRSHSQRGAVWELSVGRALGLVEPSWWRTIQGPSGPCRADSWGWNCSPKHGSAPGIRARHKAWLCRLTGSASCSAPGFPCPPCQLYGN